MEDKLTLIDLAYLAGLIDGEGSIMLSKDGKGWRPVVEITSTDRELLEWLQEKFDGTICSKKTYSENHKPSYSWNRVGRKGIDLLVLALPFMKIKRKIERATLLVKDYIELTPRNGKYTEEMLQRKIDLVERFHQIK